MKTMATNDQNEPQEKKESGYTPGESEFADGKDSRVFTDTKLPNGADNKEEENKSGTSEEHADFENPDDDPE